MPTTSVSLSPDVLALLGRRGKTRPVLEAALLVAALGDVPEQIATAKRGLVLRGLGRYPVNVRLSPGMCAFRAVLVWEFANFSAWAEAAASLHAKDGALVVAEFSREERQQLEAALLARYAGKAPT
jgi:hypothetical protein